MLELSPKQIVILENIAANGFATIAFPLYASAVGIKKGNCAALLMPIPNGGLSLLGEPCWLIDDNFTVRIRKTTGEWFVWKKQEVEATAERIAQIVEFRRELDSLLVTNL